MPNSDQNQNPLAAVDPNSLEELFSRDPLSLTALEIETTTASLVRALRAERLVWENEVKKAKLTGKRVSGGTTKKLQKAAALKAIASSSAKLDLGAIMPKLASKGGK